jgi:alkane 1-monooxygenase
MFVIALIPPLWKALMNPRVEAYYKDDEITLAEN